MSWPVAAIGGATGHVLQRDAGHSQAAGGRGAAALQRHRHQGGHLHALPGELVSTVHNDEHVRVFMHVRVHEWVGTGTAKYWDRGAQTLQRHLHAR